MPLEDFDLVLTDPGADPKMLAAWDAAGIRYQVVREHAREAGQ